MLKRTISSLIGIAIVVTAVLLPSIYPLAVIIAIGAVLGVCELYHGAEKINIRPIWWLGILATLVCVSSSITFPENLEKLTEEMLASMDLHIMGFAHLNLRHDVLSITPMFPMMITGLLFLGFITEFFRKERKPLKNISATLFGAIYVGWLLSHIIMLKCFSGEMFSIMEKPISAGSGMVMLVFLCTWATDTFAFLVGKKFGKHKLSPQSSPNKTWEGSIGGWIGSVVLALITGWFIQMPIFHALLMGAVFGIASQLGDLTESAIKREIGIKDFGNLIPGHGGILDRIDSILFTAPFAYYYIMLFLPQYM